MDSLNRRQFTQASLGSLLTFTLLDTLFHCDALGEEVRPITAQWLTQLDQLGRDARAQKLQQTLWQSQVEELLAKVPLPDLLELIDFDKLTKNLVLLDNGAKSLRFSFREVEGVPAQLIYGKQIFALKRGRSVVPHGHNNMATAFLILKGQLQGRHYDRLEDEPKHLIIRPTSDRLYNPGDPSSISDYKDNVHWFQAVSEDAYILNLHVLDVAPERGFSTGRVYCDPKGESLSDERIRAPRLGYKQAHELYG
jgi:hypothetical protein